MSARDLQGAQFIDADVLIVGGGGAGLTASMLLSRLGVDHLLINARPKTSDLPKAHVLNQRSMEILDDLGVAEAIARRSTPPEGMAATAFYAGFAGPDSDYGRRMMKLEAWGAGGADENWRSASPCIPRNLPQIRLEPVLRDRAQELAPGSIRFDHTLVALEQDESGATATVRENATGAEHEVRSRYVIGADGGRTLPELLGIQYEGLGVVTQTATLHVSADFSKLAPDPDVLIRWIISPANGSGIVMVPMGPEKWGPDSEEWVIHLNYPVGDARAHSDEKVEADARAALGVPDLPMTIHRITRWAVDAVLAASFREGRVFLVGDSAHRHPPTGGLGLNSAMQDVHNLCWKLAATLDGQAAPELLDTYEPERRPVVALNAQRSLENAVNHFTGIAELGLSHEQTAEENWAKLKRFFGDSREDVELRRRMQRITRAQSMEFCEHNVEYGFTYESKAIVADGTPPLELPDDVRVYEPSTRPGSPLPHAWLEDEDGTRRPVKDLVEPGRFLLIAGEDGEAWCEAARELADAEDVRLDAVRIGHIQGDLYDPRCTWLRRRQIDPDGAILVRPDRFVAWRSAGAVADASAELADALSRILGRPVGVPAGAAS